MSADLKHRAKIRLTPQILSTMLDLPPGSAVVAVDASNDPLAVHLIVDNPNLPGVPIDSESPFAQMEWEAVTVEAETDQGEPRRFLRVQVRWPEQTCPGGC